MGFIASDKIAVFPCGRRNTTSDPYARLTTEYNLVSIINRLVDNDSFIVTNRTYSAGGLAADEEEFSFNIGGYLFITTPKDIIDAVVSTNSAATAIYAFIKFSGAHSVGSDSLVELAKIDNSDTTLTYLDDATNFIGVKFSGEEPNPAVEGLIKSLKLFERASTSENWRVVEESKIKFETKRDGIHRSVRIDDGILGE
jgi:hypothetical protein